MLQIQPAFLRFLDARSPNGIGENGQRTLRFGPAEVVAANWMDEANAARLKLSASQP